MTEHLFDGTPEGLRGARRMLAVSWAIYLAHLAAFFVAPAVVYLSTPGDVGWLVGMAMIAAVCVLDILPQARKVVAGRHAGQDDHDVLAGDLDLICMGMLVIAAILMGTADPVGRAGGAFMWFANHLFILGPPPRIEREPT